jgi:hypothetical protein
MAPEERSKFLADRPPENRKRLIAKLAEYKMLDADQRDLRFTATELHWYLLPLMRTAATNRVEQVKTLPEKYRKLVEDRLNEWDRLPRAVQKELLDNEAAIQYFTDQRAHNTNSISAARRAALEGGVRQLQAMPEAQRQKLLDRFNQFFELTSREKTEALSSLPEAERRQIEKTLRDFGQLSGKQRAQCLRSFPKFLSLSVPERQQFLKKADRWAMMSPKERQQWRDLVRQVPMLPEGLNPRAMPPLPDSPPDPRQVRPNRPTSSLVTNGN